MTIYIIHMVEILLTGYFIQPNRSKIRGRFYLFIQFVVFTLIYTLRSYTVGRDTKQFVTAFNTLNGRSYGVYYDRELESGFEWLCRSVGAISDDYHILFLFIALFMFFALSVFVYKNSHDVVLSLYLYSTMTYFAFMLSSMRQALAISIILLFSEIGLKRRRYILFAAGVVIASLFHSSALIALSLIILHRMKFNRRTAAFVAAVCVMLPIMADMLYRFAARFLPYDVYIGTQFYDASLLGAVFILMIWLFMFAVSAAVWLNTHEGISVRREYRRDMKKHRAHFWSKLKKGKIVLASGALARAYPPDFLLWCGAAAVMVASISLRISVCSRAVYYYGMYCLILLPDAISMLHSRGKRQLFRFIVISGSFVVWLIIAVFRPEWYDQVPYTTDLW